MSSAPDPEVPRYPIGVAVRRTGLSATLLRAWEGRHGAVTPDRSGGGHRLYSEAEIRRLVLLRLLVERGHRIGAVGGLPTRELEGLLVASGAARSGIDPSLGTEPDGGGEDGPGGGGTAPGGADPGRRGLREGALSSLRTAASEAIRIELVDGIRGEAMEAVRAGDPHRVEAILRRALLLLGPGGAVIRIVVPLLERMGRLWAAGELGPGRERPASGAVRRALEWALEGLGTPPRTGAGGGAGRGLLVGTPRGHRHELGALGAALVAAEDGWRPIVAGPDLPPEAILEVAREQGAAAVALSALHPMADRRLVPGMARVRAGLSPAVPVLLGGGAARAWEAELGRAGILVLPDLANLAPRLRRECST